MATNRLLELERIEAKELFLNYLESFDIYVEANAIAKGRGKAVLLCLLGVLAFSRLHRSQRDHQTSCTWPDDCA